ncbi:hypothetical protein G9A89_012121 [Geosiphon pyriformis]|nr:hypothetical protein G9A89_012121 [Geosiphon pyriformis]
MKKIAEKSGFNGGFKPVLSRKKRKSVALEESAGGKQVPTKIFDGHFWSSETGDTTESESINMKKECLVEKTSFDYGEKGVLTNGDYNSTSKGPSVITTKALGKPLDKIDFLGYDDNNNNVFLDTPLELLPSLKNLVSVSVRKSFALDIGLDKVVGKSSQDKLTVVRKLFSKVNGIICASFTSESSLAQATKKARVADILVNTDLKKSSGRSDRAVVVKKIPVGTLAEAVHTVLSEFDSVVSIKMQLVGLWQKAVADLVTAKWFILIKKDVVRVAKTNLNKESWNTRDQHRALLYTLLTRCAIVCFNSAVSIDAVIKTTPILKDTNLWWAHLSSAKCAKYGNLDHTSLNCSVSEKTSSGGLTHRILSENDKSRLVFIYARHSVPISSNIVGRSSLSFLPVRNGSASSGFSSEIKPTLLKCIDMLAKRLDSSGPMVFQPSPRWTDIVMSEGSGVATSGETIAGVAVFNPSVMSKMEETLNNLSITVMGLLAKIDNAGLADVVHWHKESENVIFFITETKLRPGIRSWIMNKFERVHVFSSGLDKEFLDVGVAIIMNSSLVCHVSKIEDIPGQVILVWLLFKDKLSVTVLGLYAGASASAADRFGQASVINSFIAKAVNSSTFMVLGRNFNKNGSRKSASFKFCSDFSLVNSFAGHLFINASTWSNLRGVVKVIDFIFVSRSLSFAVTSHQVEPASEFFDTNHNAVLILIGLGGLLDTSLNSVCKQPNRDRWKFKIKEVGIDKWLHFKKCSLTRFLDVVVGAANEVFSRCWFSELDCSRNKHSSKFFKLELLVAKLVKCLRLSGSSGTDCLIQVWSRVNEKKASSLCNMIDDGVSLDSILCHLSNIKKRYYRSKYIEFKVAKDVLIRKAIEKYIKNFSSNKEHIIKSVLECSFHKVVLDYLVVDNDLILLPDKVKSTYALLDYVDNNAFCDVMSNISSNKFFWVIKSLPNRKAAGFSGIPNKLWKHSDELVLGGLLDITNACLVSGAVLIQWKQAWVSIIPKLYDWERTFTNIKPIALVETA